jgi:hypothetical protein
LCIIPRIGSKRTPVTMAHASTSRGSRSRHHESFAVDDSSSRVTATGSPLVVTTGERVTVTLLERPRGCRTRAAPSRR